LLGIEPRAWFGVPIAAFLIWFLVTPRRRNLFITPDDRHGFRL
jgi:hypothetical protein